MPLVFFENNRCGKEWYGFRSVIQAMIRTRATSKRIHGLLFALAVAIAIVTVIFGMKGIRDQTRRDLKNDLQTVLSTTQNALNIWARETKKRVFLWANVKETKINVKSQIRLLHSLKKRVLERWA